MSTATRIRGAALALLAAIAASTAACRSDEPRRVRIVLVTLDTLRLDSFDGTPSPMPHTARRARDGLVFDRYYATASTTKPTHATLFTARQPWEHGVTRNHKVLAPHHVTLAEQLRDAGYSTGAVVASFALAKRFQLDQGFEVYDDELERGYAGKPAWSAADHVTDAAIAQIDANPAAKQFYWFHYFDPHNPYGASTGAAVKLADVMDAVERGDADTAALVALAREHYDRDVRFLDEQLERLFRRLDEDANAYETHVLVSSDHGESFGEDGSLSHDKRLTEVMIRVPFFILSPRIDAGRHEEPVGSIDLMATVLSLAGVTASAPAGRDLSADPVPARLFGMRRTWANPVEEARLDGRRYPVPTYQFYAIDGDAVYRGNRLLVTAGEEERPLRGPLGDELKALFADFEAHYESLPASELLDPETGEALRQLGYLR